MMGEEEKETDWWWIDYLEGEMDAQIEADLLVLLDHSEKDREAFDNFRLIREWVRDSDPARTLEWSAVELNHGRRRIMSQIQRSDARESSDEILKRL